MLSSGAWIEIEQVKLYDSRRVGEISSLRARAAKALGGSGHIVGVVGAPSWTLAAEATALSLVTGFLQGAIQKQAAEALRRAQVLYEDLLERSGRYFEMATVRKIRVPHPLAWSATADGQEHIHSGDDFVWMRNREGEFAIQWQHISIIADKDAARPSGARETRAAPHPAETFDHGTESGIAWRRRPDGQIEAMIGGEAHLFSGVTALRMAITEARTRMGVA
jgi:hypothetical protein